VWVYCGVGGCLCLQCVWVFMSVSRVCECAGVVDDEIQEMIDEVSCVGWWVYVCGCVRLQCVWVCMFVGRVCVCGWVGRCVGGLV